MGMDAKPEANNYDSFDTNTKMPMRIATIIFVIFKLVTYSLVSPEFLIHRAISGAVMLALVFVITSSNRLSKRQISILAPFSLVIIELITVPLVAGDRLTYYALIGCALVSLTYADIFGLFIMLALTTVAAAVLIFVFGVRLMGNQFGFYDDLMSFIGMVIIFAIIFLLGKYSINVLVNLRKTAEAANRSKSDFLATMSHEIRTPLNAIIGLAQVELHDKTEGSLPGNLLPGNLLPGNLLPESTRNNIELIFQSGSHLLGIINDILDISKIEAGGFELIPVEYETPSLISHTVGLNLVRLGSRPITFMLEIGTYFPLKLKGDELRLKQILNNLLSNAAKYTHEGTITLSVGYEKKEGSAALVRFTVRDTGIGIRAEDREKLFTKYAQLDTGTNRKTEGTGLGLSITKKLAEMMQGSITVESEYGKGSAFTVEVVQEIADYQAIGRETAESLRNFNYIPPEQKDAMAYSRSSGDFSGKRVLVVDDLPINLIVARDLLKPYGVVVDAVLSGEKAIEKVKRQKYDLILMDHMMPEMDGIETLDQLRRLDGFDTPIVALTANALHGMKEYYLEQGFADYLTKPIILQALDEILVKWVERKSNLQEEGGNFNLALELDAQRLDRLNHFRAAFEAAAGSGREIDAEYFDRLVALLESMAEQCSTESTPYSLLPTPHSLLIDAGRRRDAQTIRETLPALCKALQSKADTQYTGREVVDGIVRRLKDALREGDTQKAGKIVKELGAARLNAEGRELFMTLYDLVMDDNIQAALERVEEWLKY